MTYFSSLSQSSRMHESKYMSDTELQNKKLLQSSRMHESKYAVYEPLGSSVTLQSSRIHELKSAPRLTSHNHAAGCNPRACMNRNIHDFEFSKRCNPRTCMN